MSTVACKCLNYHVPHFDSMCSHNLIVNLPEIPVSSSVLNLLQSEATRYAHAQGKGDKRS